MYYVSYVCATYAYIYMQGRGISPFNFFIRVFFIGLPYTRAGRLADCAAYLQLGARLEIGPARKWTHGARPPPPPARSPSTESPPPQANANPDPFAFFLPTPTLLAPKSQRLAAGEGARPTLGPHCRRACVATSWSRHCAQRLRGLLTRALDPGDAAKEAADAAAERTEP